MADALLLQAVIDESGKFKDKNVICLAGMLAFGSFWMSLEARWRDRLQKHGIEYFHAKELWRWDGIYAAKRDMWGEAGREQVLIDFATAVQQTIADGNGLVQCVYFDAATWKTLTSEQQRLLGRPDLITFDMFLASMLYHCRQLFPEEFSVSVICDDDEELALPIYKLFRLAKKQNEIAKRVLGICFADDLAYIPLQAADLIANTFYRDKIRAESDPPLPESNIFKTLV